MDNLTKNVDDEPLDGIVMADPTNNAATQDNELRNSEESREGPYQPLKDLVYENMVMLAPNGNTLCRCGKKKVMWYLNRNLAKVVCEDPFTIQLIFEPAGNGESGDTYQLATKENCCVVCGRTDYNTKHHVVEYEYRALMPLEYKSHNSYDILIVCGPCHAKYEIEATKVKQELAVKHDAPLNGKGWFHDRQLSEVKKAASALLSKQSSKIPADRILFLKTICKNHLKKSDSEELTVEDLTQLVELECLVKTDSYMTHAQAVMVHYTTQEQITGFIQMWRQHFLDIMKPQFIHPEWGVNRRLERVPDSPSPSPSCQTSKI